MLRLPVNRFLRKFVAHDNDESCLWIERNPIQHCHYLSSDDGPRSKVPAPKDRFRTFSRNVKNNSTWRELQEYVHKEEHITLNEHDIDEALSLLDTLNFGEQIEISEKSLSKCKLTANEKHKRVWMAAALEDIYDDQVCFKPMEYLTECEEDEIFDTVKRWTTVSKNAADSVFRQLTHADNDRSEKMHFNERNKKKVALMHILGYYGIRLLRVLLNVGVEINDVTAFEIMLCGMLMCDAMFNSEDISEDDLLMMGHLVYLHKLNPVVNSKKEGDNEPDTYTAHDAIDADWTIVKVTPSYPSDEDEILETSIFIHNKKHLEGISITIEGDESSVDKFYTATFFVRFQSDDVLKIRVYDQANVQLLDCQNGKTLIVSRDDKNFIESDVIAATLIEDSQALEAAFENMREKIGVKTPTKTIYSIFHILNVTRKKHLLQSIAY